jgi:hypothetical protein
MNQRPMLAIAMALILLAGCASTTASPSPSAQPVATSFEEYAIAFCSAFDSMFRAVGNPDTGSGSVLSTSLDAAVTAGDVASAERFAGTITSELEAGRQHVAVAAGWEPAGPMMARLDRVFVAFEAMIAAKRAAAAHAPNAVVPQTAFEQAGGAEAWFAMFEAGRAMKRATGTPDHHCPTVPVGT